MPSPLRLSSRSHQNLGTLVSLILLAGCGGGGGIVLPLEGEPAAIAVVDGDEQRGRVGEPLNDPLVVQVTDSRGRPVEGATVAFEFSSAGAGAAVVPQEKTTDGDGLADARLVLGTGVGRQTGQARVVLPEGREPIQASFSAMALPENANNMEAVAGQDQTGHVGLPLDDRLVVEVTDGFGNPVAGVPIGWAAVGGGSVSDDVVETDEDGRSRVDRTLGPAVGQQTTLASAEGLAGSPVTFVHTALAGDASRLVILSGNDQTAEAGSMLPDELVVQLVDADGNGVPRTAVSWVVATGGGAATPDNGTTDGDGRTSARWTLGGTLGQQRLDAVVSGVGIASFRATAVSLAPPSLFIRTQPSASARNGVSLARQPVLQLRDSQGNDVAQAGVQVTAAIGSGGGELGGTRQVSTDAAGQATFTNLSISGAPGPRTLVFTASGYAQGTSSEIDLQPIGTTTTITGDLPDPSTAGSTFPVQVRVTSDGPTPTGTVTVTVSGGTPACTVTLSGGVGSCSLTLSIVGDRNLTATYSAAPGFSPSSDTEPHEVTATPPPQPAATVTTITDDTPDPSISGSTFTVRFQVTSAAGTPTGSVRVTVSGSGTDCTGNLSGGRGSCQLTLTGVGERTLTASYSGASGFAASSDTETHTVSAPVPQNEAPDADYNWDCDGLTCQFTDASEDDDGDVVAWSWDFDGTGTSNERNPTHTFPGPGEYDVTLTVTDDDGAIDESEAEVEVEAPPQPNQPPIAEFTWNCDELECDFESQSRDDDGRIEDYAWTFGDGGTDDDDDPEHEYSGDGTYQVTLRVTDNDGATNSVTHPVTVAEDPPPPVNTTTTITGDTPEPSNPEEEVTVSFTVSSASGTPSGTVQVTDEIGGGCTGSAPSGSCNYTPVGTGTRTITATYQGNSSFNGSSGTTDHTVAVPPPPEPGELRLSTQPPSSTEDGERLEPEPEIMLLDAGGNAVQIGGVPVTVAADAGVLGGPTVRNTNDQGRARFDELRIRGEEGISVTLAFSAPGYGSVDSQPILIENGDDDDDDDG